MAEVVIPDELAATVVEREGDSGRALGDADADGAPRSPFHAELVVLHLP